MLGVLKIITTTRSDNTQPTSAVGEFWLTYPVVDADVNLTLARVDLGSREGANLDPGKDEKVDQRKRIGEKLATLAKLMLVLSCIRGPKLSPESEVRHWRLK